MEAEHTFEDGVVITQYLRPDGRTRTLYARDLSEDAVRQAIDKQLLVSAEVLRTGEIAIYVRRADQDEEEERIAIAQNDDRDPTIRLERLINEA